MRAAAEVVGEVGYAEASITMITQRAGVGQGTFYNYFKSRQDILDTLLPDLGEQMLGYVHEKAVGGLGFPDLEERSFRAFFDFIKQTPHFSRILNEAESFAPVGFQRHLDNVARRYIRFLKRSVKSGEFTEYSEAELEVIAYMLMAARSYLSQRYTTDDGRNVELPQSGAKAYMKFVLYGLMGQPRSGE
uniref:Putative transcriptional regulator, TetR-like n=1 Tax=Ralstonia syzygii R24 TaxID=907261 RepID=G3A7H7_9RALS|nr:putative transcriptional regulator, TetR-like [Ralstonia syzygii R24]